jgi:CheY-like chemotaxis protein
VDAKPISVLLVGETPSSSRRLLQWLSPRSCCCQFAQSCQDARNLVSSAQFDLVISQYQLSDRTAFPLLDWLAGSPATLFFSTRVEGGYLWLKMLERGKRCVGAPVLRQNSFLEALSTELDTAVEPHEMEGVAVRN